MCLVSRNSCKNAFGNWTRDKFFRLKKTLGGGGGGEGGGDEPPALKMVNLPNPPSILSLSSEVPQINFSHTRTGVPVGVVIASGTLTAVRAYFINTSVGGRARVVRLTFIYVWLKVQCWSVDNNSNNNNKIIIIIIIIIVIIMIMMIRMSLFKTM